MPEKKPALVCFFLLRVLNHPFKRFKNCTVAVYLGNIITAQYHCNITAILSTPNKAAQIHASRCTRDHQGSYNAMEFAQTEQREQREFKAMRTHVEQLLASGWRITARFPLTLEWQGRKSVVRCGVLISSQ
jgi:hypothetical protein